jgi:hypothetical protein
MPRETAMPTTANLLRVISEIIVLLLGALLILLAVSHTLAFPSRTGVWIALGVFLIYWGVRAGARPESPGLRKIATIRGSSLVVVGLVVIQVPLLPVRYEAVLLGFAGTILVIRGILGGILYARTS